MILQHSRPAVSFALLASLIAHCMIFPTECLAGRRFYSRPVVTCVGNSCCSSQLAECRRRVALLSQEVSSLKQSLATCEEKRRCLEQQLHETQKDRERITAKLAHVRRILAHTCRKLQAAEDQVKCLTEKLEECEAAGEKAQEELKGAQKLLTECEAAKEGLQKDLEEAGTRIHGLELQLAQWGIWTWVLVALALILLLLLISLLWHALLLRHQRERDRAAVQDYYGRYQKKRSMVVAYKQQIEQLTQSNMYLHNLKDEYRTGKAFAEKEAAVSKQETIGTVRELAAHKKDCCYCKCSTPAVVYGPGPVFGDKTQGGTTPMHGGNTPNNGNQSPNNGDPALSNPSTNNPSSTSPMQAASPNNSVPNNGNPNNADPNNGNPNNGNPNNGIPSPNNATPNNGNPNNSNPNNANPDNANPNNGNPNNSNPNNANPDNSNPNNANPNNGNPNNGNPSNATPVSSNPNNGNNNPTAENAAAAANRP